MSSISGLYSPLPQSQSDSDSERDLPMNATNQIHKHFKADKIHKSKGHHNSSETKSKPNMTTARKIAFTVSIIQCFIPIVVFLWILPCDIDTCPVKLSNWETQQEGVEMKGTINLFFERFKKQFNLAVLYKGDITSKEMLKHGVISFLGNNGGVNWYFRQEFEPENLDCSLIDVDQDGVSDCLLLDEKGLKAVEIESGQIIWHVHSHEERRIIDSLQFPILLNDMNHDGIKELLSIYQKKYLMIICGRTGKAILNLVVQECDDIEGLQKINEFVIFNCTNGSDTLNLRTKLSAVSDAFLDNNHSLNFEKNEYYTSESNSFTLGGYQLYIENRGNCPDCNSTIQIHRSNKLIYSKLYKRSFIINPSKFQFESTKFKLALFKGHIKGFIIKIWDWYDRFNPQKSRINFKEDSLNNTNYGNHIIERVMLITFNNTDYNIIEASSTNITQLCFMSQMNILDCQPNVKNQQYSLLISDLDRDGSQELITYSSTFYFRESSEFNTQPWLLISTIKLVQLESELPKLYDSRQTFGILSNY